MTRKQIVADFKIFWCEHPDLALVDFVIEQVNKALDEAQVAIGSARAAEAIELCKVKP